MPIKPENKLLYPSDWPQVRARILKRAGYRCEFPGCLCRQYAIGVWSRWPGPHFTWQELWWREPSVATYAESLRVARDRYWCSSFDGKRPIIVVLTIAHLDHNPTNCDDSNLLAGCQRHHLAHDHQHHLANAQVTRRAKAGSMELF